MRRIMGIWETIILNNYKGLGILESIMNVTDRTKKNHMATIWHYKAARVMLDGDPEGWVFLPAP